MPKDTFNKLQIDKKNRITEAILKEVSRTSFESVNIQNIIKDAKIPRGSFYQYFEDKMDMYGYIMNVIRMKKGIYFKDLFESSNLSFIERIEAIYIAGIKFKYDHPELVKAGEYMLQSPLFMDNPLVSEGVEQMISLYESWIIKDQKQKLINDQLDSRLLATMMMELLNKMTIDSFIHHKMDEASYENSIKMMIDIFKRGISHV